MPSFANVQSSTTTSGTSDTVNVPTGLVDGDHILVLQGKDDNPAFNAPTNLAGCTAWTEIYSDGRTAGNDTGQAGHYCRVTDAASLPSTISCTWADNEASWRLAIRVVDADPDDFTDSVTPAFGKQTGTNTPDPLAVTTNTDDSKVVVVFSTRNTSDPLTHAWNSLGPWKSSGTGVGSARGGAFQHTNATAGSDDPPAAASGTNNRDWHVVTFAIKQAGGGPVTGSGSTSAATSAAGTGSKTGQGAANIPGVATAAAGAGSKIGAGSGSVAVASSSAGAGQEKASGAGAVFAGTGLLGSGQKLAAGDTGGPIGAAVSLAGTGQKLQTGAGAVAVATSVTASGTKAGKSGTWILSAAVALSGAGDPVGGPVTGSGSVAVASSTAGTGSKIGAGSGSVAVASSTAGAGQEVADGEGLVPVATSVAGTGQKLEAGAGAVAVAVAFSVSAGKLGAGSSTAAVAVSLAGAGGKTGQSSGAVAVAVSLAGAGTAGTPQGSGAVAVAVSLAGGGRKIGQGAGTLAAAVALAGAAATMRTGSASLAVATTVFGAGFREDATLIVDTASAGRGVVIPEAELNGIATARLVVQLSLGNGTEALWDEAIWGTDAWSGFDTSWLDVSAWVVSAKTKMGRSAANESFPAGNAQLRLLNTFGEWSLPGQGPGQLDLAPGVRCRVSVETATAGLVSVWTGFVSVINEVYGRDGRAYVDVFAVDASAWIGRAGLLGNLWSAGADPVVAVRRALDAAGWPRGALWRDISAAVTQHTIAAYDPAGESAIDVVRRVADAEGGAVFVDPLGRPTLKGRDWLSGTDGDAPSLVIDTKELGDLDLRDVLPRKRSTDRVINEARFKRLADTGTEIYTVQDGGSKGLYGHRSSERLDLLCNTVAQVEYLADRLVLYRAAPVVELEKVRVRPQSDVKAAAAVSAAIGDVVRVDYEHPREAWSWSQPANLVGVEHEIRTSGTWTVTLHADVTYQQGIGVE